MSSHDIGQQTCLCRDPPPCAQSRCGNPLPCLPDRASMHRDRELPNRIRRRGGSMAADTSPTGAPPPEAETVVVSDEALLKAEAFVEAEEGAANRLMGWAGRISTAIAVVMSLFHLYAAYAIVPPQELRYAQVACKP